MRQRTDCSSTTGLVGPAPGVARIRGRTQIRTAQPGSIRCTGFGAIAASVQLVEFANCRSDLSMHLRWHVRHGTRIRVAGLIGGGVVAGGSAGAPGLPQAGAGSATGFTFAAGLTGSWRAS